MFTVVPLLQEAGDPRTLEDAAFVQVHPMDSAQVMPGAQMMSSGAQVTLLGAQVMLPGAQVMLPGAQVMLPGMLPGAQVTPLGAQVMKPTMCTPLQVVSSSSTPPPDVLTPFPGPGACGGPTPSVAEPSFTFTPSPSTSTTSPNTSRDYTICSQEESCTREGSVGVVRRRKPIRQQKAVPTVSSEKGHS